MISQHHILELCKRHELQIKNINLSWQKLRWELTKDLLWWFILEKKCKCVHSVRVVSLKTNDTSASPGFSTGKDNKQSVKCLRGRKTRCHRRRGRCWCGPSLSTARELFTRASPRLIMSTNRATWMSCVGAARVERQTSLWTLQVKCRSAGWRSSLSVQGNFPRSECPCRCPFTVLLS